MSFYFSFHIRPNQPYQTTERIKKWLSGQPEYEAVLDPTLTAIEIKVTKAPYGMTTEKIKELFEKVAEPHNLSVERDRAATPAMVVFFDEEEKMGIRTAKKRICPGCGLAVSGPCWSCVGDGGLHR